MNLPVGLYSTHLDITYFIIKIKLGVLGIVLTVFGIRTTRLIHAICGGISVLLLASLLFDRIRTSVYFFCLAAGGAAGVMMIPGYPDMV